MSEREGLSRRSLLRRGGVGAAGVAMLGTGLRTPPAGAAGNGDPHNVLVLVLPMLRADFIGIYPGTSRADTPHIDALAKQSLRFEHAVAESGPAWPVRRCLMTGMRSFPFRNWRRTEGMPAVPGFNPIYDYQPVMLETARQAGVNAVWVTDNPLLTGARFEGVHPAGGSTARRPQAAPGIESDFIPSLRRARDAGSRSLQVGTTMLEELDRQQPFLLVVDGFDPQDAYEAPRVYVRKDVVDRLGWEGLGGRLVPTHFDSGVGADLSERYARAVEAMDREVGRLLDRLHELKLADNTLVILIGDHGVALGEHGYIGKAAPTSHRLSHELAFIVRHPNGRLKGDRSWWHASTHDVPTTALSYLGVTIPGKMDGEDLTQLFHGVEDEDLPERKAFTTVTGTVMLAGNKRFLAVVDRKDQERWLYDDEEKDDHTRFENAAGDNPGDLQALSQALAIAAGGTLPEWGPDGTERPLPEQTDDDVDGDGIRNDDDPINDDDEGDDDYKDDDSRAGAVDGGDPTGKVGNFLGGGTGQPPTGQRGRYFSGDQPIP
jgi:arylsulfatase A-like enzyme